MQRRFDPLNVFLCTLAGVGFLVAMGAVAWGMTRGAEYASWMATIGGLVTTAIGAAGSLVRWLLQSSKVSEGERGTPEESASPAATSPAVTPSSAVPSPVVPSAATPPPGGNSAGRNMYNQSHNRTTINSGPVLVIIAGLLALGLVIVWLAYTFEEELAACERPTSTTGEDLPISMTSVVYTEGVGLSTFCGPASTYLRAGTQELRDGAMVEIVCKEMDGQFREDPLNEAFPDDHPRDSTVWYLLSNGGWVSDMYVGTPKVVGDPAADGISECDGSVAYETTALE